MKKWIAAVLCLMMVSCCAMAEEQVRDYEMLIEGNAEKVIETRYQSEAGYEIWYPSEYVTVGEKYGHDCFYPVHAGEESDIYFMIVSADANPEDVQELPNEAVGGFGPEAQIGETVWAETESGALLGSVQVMEGDTFFRFYLVSDKETILLITACFPAEAAEGFGVRFDRMAQTISFEQISLTARYEGEGYAISYPAELLTCAEVLTHDGFVPIEGGAESGVYLMIVKSSVAPEHAVDMLNEAVGGYENADEAIWSEETTLASGLLLRSVEIEQDEKIDRYYLLTGEEAMYCLTASFSADGGAEYGAAFDAMAKSFELTAEE